MPEFNDRRPRTQMRVKAKDIIPGDHYVHPETGSVTPVAQVTPDMGDYDSGRPANGHFITMANGRSTNVPNNSKHTVRRLTGEGPTDGSVESMPQWATRGRFGR